jgi:arylsulfatase A-like enzyme
MTDPTPNQLHAPTDLEPSPRAIRPLTVLLISAWCGLVAGLLEVATIIIRKEFFDDNHLYGISRHFVWIIPGTNLGLFVAVGLLLLIATIPFPFHRRFAVTRALCALTILPIFLIAGSRIYTLAWLAIALGIAFRLVPWLEFHSRIAKRTLLVSFPLAVVIFATLAASLWMVDRPRQLHEWTRSLPGPEFPNVLLVILDTVAADHLDLYGYPRPTSTTLRELAQRGITFTAARSTCSWTLPSHATMFTGRWLHELSVGWLNPLDDAQPTLAEYLGYRGYATAGFIANTAFCASDTGLARGFTHYDDFIFPRCTAFKSAVLVNHFLSLFGRILPIIDERPSLAWLRPAVQAFWRSFVFDRKPAATVNAQLFDWLAKRSQANRPFFAFLNYYDAHTPYKLPTPAVYRFGSAPKDERQRELITRWGDLDKTRVSPNDLPFVVDSYDDCIADLDEQIGRLVDKLKKQGILDHTWLIVASDHGESFGEHPGVFCHGSSLYQTEIHVPLIIVPPGGRATPAIVTETVSLRDLAATIADILNLQQGSPLPGQSLAKHWSNQPPTTSDLALAEVLPGLTSYRDANGLPKKSWPVAALSDGTWSYIRGKASNPEELFNLQTDRAEQRNLARDPALQPILDRLRKSLVKLTNGPLTPDRFNR